LELALHRAHVEGGLLGDLDLQHGGGQAEGAEALDHDLVHRHLRHLPGQDIDRHADHRETTRAQDLHHAADLLQDVAEQRLGETGRRGRRDQVRGRYPAEPRVPPAHQRFQTRQHPGIAGADRLEPDLQGILRQRLGQVALKVAPHLQALAQNRIEQPVAVPTSGLRGVECLVGAAQHLGQAGLRAGMNADADPEPAGVEAVERLRDRGDQARRQDRVARAGRRGIVQDGEFVAPEPRGEALLRQRGTQPAGHLDQHAVAGLVAIDVIVSTFPAVNDGDFRRL
jgi:hypothetical protein